MSGDHARNKEEEQAEGEERRAKQDEKRDEKQSSAHTASRPGSGEARVRATKNWLPRGDGNGLEAGTEAGQRDGGDRNSSPDHESLVELRLHKVLPGSVPLRHPRRLPGVAKSLDVREVVRVDRTLLPDDGAVAVPAMDVRVFHFLPFVDVDKVFSAPRCEHRHGRILPVDTYSQSYFASTSRPRMAKTSSSSHRPPTVSMYFVAMPPARAPHLPDDVTRFWRCQFMEAHAA